MTTRPPLSVHAALLVVSLCFGVFHVVGKATLRDVPPSVLTLIRVAGAAAFLQLAARMRGGGRLPGGRRDLARVALYALLGVVLTQLLFLSGLARTKATSASILITTIPVFTAALAWTLGRETVGFRRLGGIALAMGGVLLLLRADVAELGWAGRELAGNLLVLGCCLAYALFLVLSHDLSRRVDSLTLIGWIFTLGLAGVLPFGLGPLVSTDFSAWSGPVWAGVAFTLVFPTMIAYWLNLWALQKAGPTLVALYVYLQPVVAALLAGPVLGERLGPRQALAAGVVFLGVYLASPPPRAAPDPELV